MLPETLGEMMPGLTISEEDARHLKGIKGNCTCTVRCFNYVGMHTNKSCQCKVHKKRKKNTKSAFRSSPTLIDDIWFASKDEALRYRELKQQVRDGLIRDLETQPKYVIEVNGVLICRYTADFRYVVVKDARMVVEDVKSKRVDKYGDKHGTAMARDWPLRKKLMKAVHGIDVLEVYMR